MSRPFFLCAPLSALLFLFAGFAWPGAAEQPKPADPGSADDVADFILILESRPVLVRLHVTVDGEPYTKHWEYQLKRLFDFLDRDGNGFLDKEEAALIPGVSLLQRLFSGDISFGIQNPGNNAPPFVPGNVPPQFGDLDADSDGRITFEEFARYFRHTEAGPLQLVARNTQGLSADALTDFLFSVLDTDKDGKLSKEELLAAEKVLRQFDTNDDELVSIQELMAEVPNRGQGNGAGLFPGTILPGKLFNNVPLMVLPREDTPRQVVHRMPAVKELLAHYDKEQWQKVRPDKIGFPKELAEKLDTGKSGWLGPKELARWVVFYPDVEMTVRLGRSPGGDRVQIPAPADDKDKPTYTPGKTGENSLAVGLEAIHMTVLRSETQFPQNQAGAKAQYMQQFKALDTKRNGYLKLDQLQKLDKDPNAIIIRSLFAWADRDTNEKLTEKELSDFLDLMMSLHGTQSRLTFGDNGQSLFELLDANRDGRLSIRELRTAWKRLEMYDKGKKGAITRGEIPRQYQLLVSQAEPFMNPNAQAGANFGVTVVQSLPTRGPLWFRKMDVNNDGDVSEREFLGSKEDFKKINTSGDGLISVEEAEAADAWFREKMKKPE